MNETDTCWNWRYVEPVLTPAERAAVLRGKKVLANPSWKPRPRAKT